MACLLVTCQQKNMKLNLTKPLIVFDLETTGLDLVKDKIIQISYIKVYPDGKEERNNLFVNPERPIPTEVAQLTGISDEDVKDAPTFKAIAADLENKFKGCDFAGFNSNHFDVPMLEKFGIHFHKPLIDTLYLSALLFPKKPYHRLVKDDKIVSEQLNDPVADAGKAKIVFDESAAEFCKLPRPLQRIYGLLLRKHRAFEGFFCLPASRRTLLGRRGHR